ncbi:MAG: hypothetical protein K2X38_04590 [Gemmataceae bacterium]|nr:hypothetical protein [Gemmataceae bacterium]
MKEEGGKKTADRFGIWGVLYLFHPSFFLVHPWRRSVHEEKPAFSGQNLGFRVAGSPNLLDSLAASATIKNDRISRFSA